MTKDTQDMPEEIYYGQSKTKGLTLHFASYKPAQLSKTKYIRADLVIPPTPSQDREKALEAISFCIETMKNSRMTDDDIAIWSVGTSQKPRITITVLKAAMSALQSPRPCQAERPVVKDDMPHTLFAWRGRISNKIYADEVSGVDYVGYTRTDTIDAKIKAGLDGGWNADMGAAPKDRAILVCGGTAAVDEVEDYRFQVKNTIIVYWKNLGWCGGPAHGEYHDSELWALPTHWRLLPAGPEQECKE